MIGKLSGLVDSIADDRALIDVGGVGYVVFCSTRTLAALPAMGEAVSLLIETHVRDDHIHLYGFAEPMERDWFGLLQSVQGVGARVALGILSALAPADLAQAIAGGEVAALTRASGVGAKLAARIVNELKDKVTNIAAFPGAAGARTAASTGDPLTSDAVSALVNLGYRPSDAMSAVAAVARRRDGDSAEIGEIIRDSLKELGR